MAGAAGNIDRLSSTLFVTALAHGVVILGVTFAPVDIDEPVEMQTLNVTLLVDTETLNASTDEAEFLAARSQQGGGDDESLRPTTTLSAAQPMNQQGEPLGVDTRTAEALAAAMPVEQVVTPNESDRRIEAVPDTTDEPAPAPMTQAALLQQSAPDSLVAELDLESSTAADEASDVLSPETRESALAAYIVGWRQRVERVGTANFPLDFLRSGAEASLVVQVAINAEGRLADASVVRSSGSRSLDQAALEILDLAGPFAPLPEAILAETNQVQFQYEWHFSSGGRTASRVR